MDRISRAEVGGPYASHDDAMRAIQNKGFDADPADLTVQEGSSDDDDDTSKESSLRRQASPLPPPADSGGGATMSPPVTNPNPTTQQITPQDPKDPMDTGSSSGAPESPQDQMGMGSPLAKTTKPSQVPSGGGGGMPGPGEDGDDVSGDENPQDPSSQQYDANDGGGPDPIGGAIASIAMRVMRDNPGTDEQSARRVARKVVGRLVQADVWNMRPHIEDPLADKNPLSVIHDVVKTLPKGSPAAAPSHEDDDESSLPAAPVRGPAGRMTPAPAAEAGAGEAAAGAGAAAEGAGLASGLGELAPLLLL